MKNVKTAPLPAVVPSGKYVRIFASAPLQGGNKKVVIDGIPMPEGRYFWQISRDNPYRVVELTREYQNLTDYLDGAKINIDVLERETKLKIRRIEFFGQEQKYSDIKLSARELEILSLVAQGLYDKEIAEITHVVEGTVKTHIRHILRKLKVRNRAEAAAYYARDLE